MTGDKDKELKALKVVLGAAWADGVLQPEELGPIHQIVDELGLGAHPEVRVLLETPVPALTYRRYLQDFLATHETVEERQNLLELLTRVIYADNEVSIEEGYILGELQDLLAEMTPEMCEEGERSGQFRDVVNKLFGSFLRRSPSP